MAIGLRSLSHQSLEDQYCRLFSLVLDLLYKDRFLFLFFNQSYYWKVPSVEISRIKRWSIETRKNVCSVEFKSLDNFRRSFPDTRNYRCLIYLL